MKSSALIMAHSLLCIVTGIAFSMYAPLMMAFFGIPEALGDPIAYWQVTSFARLFGISQLGFGLVLLALRGSIDSFSVNVRRGFLSALMLANLLGIVVAITQQQAVWLSLAGWIVTGLFTLLFIGYLILFVNNQKAVDHLSSI